MNLVPKIEEFKTRWRFLLHTWKVTTIWGIPLRLHWSLPICFGVNTLLASTRMGWEGAQLAISLYPIAFLLITIHEFGHTLMAKHYQWQVKGVTLTGIGGIASITEKKTANTREKLDIILAGPATNLLILLGCTILIGIPSPREINALPEPWTDLRPVYTQVFLVNTMLLIFNLLPIYPMDGGRLIQLIGQKLMGRQASAYLVILGCSGIGVPASLCLFETGSPIGGILLSSMSFLGLMEAMDLLKPLKEKNGDATHPANPPQNPRSNSKE